MIDNQHIKKQDFSSLINLKNTINCNGKLVDLTRPKVMGIINITPDSFYSGSRFQSDTKILKRVEEIVVQGGDIIDIGAYSSRPSAQHISKDDEVDRLLPYLKKIRKHFPNLLISVDTFRADVAKVVVEEAQVDIINDISGGDMDEKMFDTIAELSVPYILMHIQGTPQNMQDNPKYNNIIEDVSLKLANKIDVLRAKGVNDIIIDPGFGFGKTLDDNYELFSKLEEFKLFELPVLVGISRKSMIYNFFENSADDALNGTTVLNTVALLKGANVLRVHDVKEAVEAVKLIDKLNSFS